MRSKEEAHDYRYFPDPDLLPLDLDLAWIARIKATLPELPDPKKVRFIKDYGISAYDAGVLVADRETAAFYEEVARDRDAKLAANWVLGEFSAAVNRAEIDAAAAPLTGTQLGVMLKRIQDETISGKIAKEVFEAMWAGESGRDADAIIVARGLKQISDVGAIGKIVDDVIAANASIVAEYKAGKEKAFNSLVGKIMAASKGKANPAQVNAILKQKLGA